MAGNQKTFQKAMNLGHTSAWDQDWEKAVKCYQAALEEFPEDPKALSSLGLAYFELQDFESSLGLYQHAAKVAPTDPIPQEKMARIYERTGQSKESTESFLKAAELHLRARDAEKAIDNWNRVLALYPEHLPTRQRLAAVYDRLGKKAEAVNEYIAVASILQRSGDLTRAMKSVEYAIQLEPESQDARFALHTLRSNQLLPKPARPKRLDVPTRPVSARGGQKSEEGEAARVMDPVEEARQKTLVQLAAMLFDQADEGSGEMSPRRGLGLLTRGGLGAAEGASDKTRIILHLGQAIDSQSQGDEAQAIAELERALELGLRQPAAYFNLGLLQSNRDPEKSLRYLQEAVKNPDYALASHLLSGQLYLGQGNLSQAAASFMQALGLADAELVGPEQAEELHQAYEPLVDTLNNEQNPDVLKNICSTISGQLLRSDWRQFMRLARQNLPPQTGNMPVMPVAEMILESRSSQVVEMIAHVRDLASRGQARPAMEEAFFALQLAPTYLPLHTQVGELLLQEDRTDEAVRKFMVVADLYNARGETARAVRMLRRILQIASMDLTVRERLIALLVAQDKVDDALQEYMELAGSYYRLAELDKARQTYLAALKVAQQSKDNRTWGVDILLKIADIDMQRLNLRQAVRIYEQIRTIQPDNPTIRSQIVSLDFRLGQNAAAMLEVDSYITVLESSGRRAQAIEFLKELLGEYGANQDLRRRLADLYAREGHVPEAVEQLDTVATAYMDQGKIMEAINIMETIVALKPANVEEFKAALETLRRASLRK